MVDMQKTQYISNLSGFKDKDNLSVTVNVSAFSLGAGQFLNITNTTPFADPTIAFNNISSLRIKYGGLETFWRQVDGFIASDYPSPSVPDYQIGSLTYFTATAHVLYIYIANQTGGIVNVPALTIQYELNLYDGPF